MDTEEIRQRAHAAFIVEASVERENYVGGGMSAEHRDDLLSGRCDDRLHLAATRRALTDAQLPLAEVLRAAGMA